MFVFRLMMCCLLVAVSFAGRANPIRLGLGGCVGVLGTNSYTVYGPHANERLLGEIQLNAIVQARPYALIQVNNEWVKVVDVPGWGHLGMAFRLTYFGHQAYVVFDPLLMQQYHPIFQRFVFHHEAGHIFHNHVGYDSPPWLAKLRELEADAYAADQIFNEYGAGAFRIIQAEMNHWEEGPVHPPGFVRVQSIGARMKQRVFLATQRHWQEFYADRPPVFH